MKLSRSSIGWLAGLVVLAVVLGAASAVAPSTAMAAPASIHPSSCGQGLGGGAVPNAYCSFNDTGEDIVIGLNSCNVVGACLDLGDGVRINTSSLPFMEGSCNGADACSFAGASGGSFEVGHDSCNDTGACYSAGYSGGFEAGNHSCNGSEACYRAGEFGNAEIGDASCNGPNACNRAGSEQGNFVAGTHSCRGDVACLSAGRSGSFEVGHDSCSVAEACEYAGQTGDGPSSVGSFSCNYSDNLYNTECAGDVSGSRPDVGDCMYNDPVTTAQQIACVFVGAPGFGSIAGVLQSILAIFAIF